ncbi:MAG: endolytic transglycosylase MltG [Cytophagales bacterium]
MAKERKVSDKQKKQFQLQGAIIIVLGFFLASTTFYGYQILFADNVLLDKPNKSLFIPKGADFKQVVDSLEKGDFLHDRLSFMFLSKLLDYRQNVKPGKYDFETNTSNFTLIKKLKNGRQTPLKLTFNNVRTKADLVKKITKKLPFNAQNLLDTLNNADFLSTKYGFNDTTIMAMFIPNTYEVYWTFTISDFLNYFQEQYQRYWTAEKIKQANKIGLTPVQVTVMASIVEAETNKNQEKPRIAGVYMNRYNARQRLQADPTLVFATGDFDARRINEFHRYYKSPYNTYRNVGLPPGPINLPSMASIEAILNYERHSYFFFCARPDLTGYHLFSTTFDEHLQVARNYWKSLDKENIHQGKRVNQ